MKFQYIHSRRFEVRLIIGAVLLVCHASASGQAGTELWHFTTGDPILASPAIGADGTVYVGCYDRKLYAFTPEGSNKWSFSLPSSGFTGIYSSPAIGLDGTIYFGAEDGVLYALNPVTGNSKWTFDTGETIYSDPAIGPDGAIYFGSYSLQQAGKSYLYAVETNGTQRWRYQAAAGIYSDPVIGTDGTVYFGCDDRKLYAVKNGTNKWAFSTGGTSGAITASPALGSDGTIYIGTAGSKKFFAVNPNGTKKWEYVSISEIHSSAAIGPDGTIYFGTDDKNLHALHTNGTLKWKALTGSTGSKVRSSPAVARDGTVYVGSENNKLFAFSSAGSNLWSFTADDDIFSSPAIATNGTVYIAAGKLGGSVGGIYAVQATSALAYAAWPMFRHDAKHTANYVTITNTWPSISSIGSQAVDEDTALGPLAFTVFDAETAAGDLIVSTTSSNAALVSNDQIQLTSTGGSRSLSITPATNESGATLITVAVTDAAGASNTMSFLLTVQPINDAPVISFIGSQTIDELSAFTLSVIASDPETPANMLSYELTNSPAGASIDSGGVISWTPTEAQGPMTTNITVLVTDNGTPPLTASRTFQITVNEVNQAPVLTNFIATTELNKLLTVSTGELLRMANDADGHALSITGVSATSTNGGAVSLSDGFITYLPLTNYYGTDRVDYEVSDSYTIVTGYIVVTVQPGNTAGPNVLGIVDNGDGSVTITFAGIPQRYYLVQYTTNLSAPVPPTWVSVSTNQAGPSGIWTYTEPVAPGSRYYRTTGGTTNVP